MMFLLLYDKTGSPSRHIKARQILPITQPPKKESKARNAVFVVASKNFLQSAYLGIKKILKLNDGTEHDKKGTDNKLANTYVFQGNSKKKTIKGTIK